MIHLSKASVIHDLSILCDFMRQGYTFNQALDIVLIYHPQSSLAQVKEMLKEGKELNECFKGLPCSTSFKSTLSLLIDYQDLENAINGALYLDELESSFFLEIYQTIAYPIMLLLVMCLFSIFALSALLPTLASLLASFQINQHSFSFLKILTSLPYFILLLMIFMMIGLLVIVKDVKNGYLPRLKTILNLPMIGSLIQYYYSLKFAYYYDCLSKVIPSLEQMMHLLATKLQHHSLAIMILFLQRQLEEGEDFYELIQKSPFFHSTFKQFYLLYQQRLNDMFSLKQYCDQTILHLKQMTKKITTSLRLFIYLLTGIFVVGIYMVIMSSMMKITTLL